MGDARVFFQADPGGVCRAQRAHRLLSHAVGSESVREGSFEIRDGQWIDPIPDGEAPAAGADPEDHGVPSARDREMENVRAARRTSDCFAARCRSGR
jgi:hypothetical protein